MHDHVRSTVLGRSLDDAAGEAFDKGARLLGLGYPGGPAIERAAVGGDPEAVALPVAMAGREGLDLSFSGLKTALRTRLRDEQHELADLAASYQAAIVASLVSRTLASAGSERRARASAWSAAWPRTRCCARRWKPSARGAISSCAALRWCYCGDNAAMIGAAAEHLAPIAFPGYLAIDAHARANLVAQSV